MGHSPDLYKLSEMNSSFSLVKGMPEGSIPGGTMRSSGGPRDAEEGRRSWCAQLRPGSGRLGSSWSSEWTGGTRGGDEEVNGDKGGCIEAKGYSWRCT